MRSVHQLRENMLKLQKDNAIINEMNDIALRVRRSYSADSLIMKSILEEVSFRNMDLEQLGRTREDMGLVVEVDFSLKSKAYAEEGPHHSMPTSPPSMISKVLNNNSNGLSAASVVCY
jgi:hypothetical protein